MNLFLQYINESRYNSVISKVGEVTLKDFGKIIKEFSNDAEIDLIKDNPEYEKLEKDSKNKIRKVANKSIIKIIKENLWFILIWIIKNII